jgi:hypothetical protein
MLDLRRCAADWRSLIRAHCEEVLTAVDAGKAEGGRCLWGRGCDEHGEAEELSSFPGLMKVGGSVGRARACISGLRVSAGGQ